MSRNYVIYSRVSTDEQATYGYSLGAMLDKCKSYIASQEDAVLVKYYEDKGFSGTLSPSKRPALRELLDDLQTKKVNFDTILVWKLDRLSRSMRDTLNIEYILRKAGKSLESVTEKIDTASSAGRMFFQIISSFSEMESSVIGERTRNTMAARVGYGYLGGRAPMGYALIKRQLKVKQPEADKVCYMFKKFVQLQSLRGLARDLNEKEYWTPEGRRWNHKTVQRILSNPVYTGSSVWGRRARKIGRINNPDKWITVPHTHVAIISPARYRQVEDLLLTSKAG